LPSYDSNLDNQKVDETVMKEMSDRPIIIVKLSAAYHPRRVRVSPVFIFLFLPKPETHDFLLRNTYLQEHRSR
jgi:L-lysine 2,3-aminomutase